MTPMNAQARHALRTIQQCIAHDRYRMLRHCIERMDARGLFWADILAAIDEPAEVQGDGHDDYGRPRWIISGATGDGLAVEIVAVIDEDEAGKLTVFITIYTLD